MTSNKWQKLNILNDRCLNLSTLLCEESSRIVIVCHGFTGSKEGGGRALEMGEQLSELGFSTLLFDFSGCGESEGSWQDLTLSGQADDLAAVVRWSRANGFQDIVVTGRSFGGSTALIQAARDRKITAVCTWAAVARPQNLFESFINKNLLPPAENVVAIEGEGEVLYIKKDFFENLKKHDLLDCASKLTPRSYLVIHGSEDESVPVEDAHLLYNAAAQPKNRAIIEGADHRFTDKITEVWHIFFEWLNTLDYTFKPE